MWQAVLAYATWALALLAICCKPNNSLIVHSTCDCGFVILAEVVLCGCRLKSGNVWGCRGWSDLLKAALPP